MIYTNSHKGTTALLGLWFCAVLLWVLPNHGGSGLALPQNLLAWSVLALIALWCAVTAQHRKTVYPPGVLWIVIGAALWSLPILWSPSPAWQWNALPKVLALWGLVAVWLILLKSTTCHLIKRQWLLILVIATVLQVIYGAGQLSDIASLPKGRPYGSFQQINVYASFLATGLLCALWLFTLSRRKLALILSAVALVITPAMLVLLQSRTGYLGAIIGSAIMLLARRQHRRPALVLLMTGTLAGLCLLYFGPKYFPGMIPTLVQSEGSTVQRWYMLRLTWQLICEHPIVGNGYGSFEVLLGQLSQQIPPGIESTTIQYPHNEFLYTWMEGGIVAVAGLLLMVAGVCIRLWGKGVRRWTGLALLLPIAIHMNLEYPLYQSVTHGITLVMLLTIAGPAARAQHTAKPSGNSFRISVGVVASVVLVFMLSGTVSEVQLTRIEQQGLMPLAQDDTLSLVNPWSQHDRLDFDRHVALLVKFNRTQNAALLTQYRAWAEAYLQVHNNPDVYNSLMMIYRAWGLSTAQELCLKAKAMWPADLRFNCD